MHAAIFSDSYVTAKFGHLLEAYFTNSKNHKS